MTAPADEQAQDAPTAEPEAPVENAEGDEAGNADDAAGGGEDQDNLAAEWEAMVGGEDGDDAAGAGAGRESTRVLNQDEIDSLLGFDDEQEEGSEKSGIQALLNSALVSY